MSELSLEDRCRMFALRMPATSAFSHVTAARLLSIPLPWGRERQVEVDVAFRNPDRAPHVAGVRGHKLDLSDSDIHSSNDIQHTSPARTWCDLAAIIPLLDLVAAGDFIIHRGRPLATIGELATAARRFTGRRGMRTIREALPLLDDAAESPPESMLRAIIARAGLPLPSINRTLIDAETGKALRPDFLFGDRRVILEYQGDYHRTKSQWRKDMTRRELLESRGWRVVELNWDDLRDPHELARRIRVFLRPRS